MRPDLHSVLHGFFTAFRTAARISSLQRRAQDKLVSAASSTVWTGIGMRSQAGSVASLQVPYILGLRLSALNFASCRSVLRPWNTSCQFLDVSFSTMVCKGKAKKRLSAGHNHGLVARRSSKR